MTEWLVSFFMLAGTSLMLLSAIGVTRLPDLPTRMHATTKAGALGISLIMLAVALAFMQAVVFARVLAIISFVMLTAPVAAHVIGRAGYFVGVPLWDGSVKDELRDNYNPQTHALRSGLEKTEKKADDEPVSKR